MLCLSRNTNESIIISHNIRVTVLQVRGNTVRLGIEAPREVTVHREEIEVEIEQQGRRPLNLFAGYPASHGTLTTE